MFRRTTLAAVAVAALSAVAAFSAFAGATGTAGAQRTAGAPGDLRVTLDRLLGEHANLAVFAMQKGYSGQADFKATAAALDRNSVALAGAIGSVYGPQARAAFLKQWREHIGFFVDYTVGLAKKDAMAQKQALARLAAYRVSFSRFLNGANPNLPAAAVSGLLQQHVNQLTAALRTYAKKQYGKAYAQQQAAYAHMFMTGDALAGAIVKQSPSKFPNG